MGKGSGTSKGAQKGKFTGRSGSGLFTTKYGTTIVQATADPNTVLVSNVTVQAEQRGKGYGKQLVQSIVTDTRARYPKATQLDVVASRQSRRFWRKQGFVETGETGLGGEAIRMRRTVS